jgi:hypothetical protein
MMARQQSLTGISHKLCGIEAFRGKKGELSQTVVVYVASAPVSTVCFSTPNDALSDQGLSF